MLYELTLSGINVVRQHPLPVVYKGINLDCGFRLDLWVENKVVIELKAVESLNDVHLSQVITYLKLTNNRLGLLINFNVALIRDGIRRIANGM